MFNREQKSCPEVMYTIPQTSIQLDPSKIKNVRADLIDNSYRKVYKLVVDMDDAIIETDFTCYTREYADWLVYAVSNGVE